MSALTHTPGETRAVPAYREPFSHGAYAYPQADTLPALWNGVKRRRKPLTVHLAHSALTGLLCPVCGQPFDAPYPVNPGDPPAEWHTDKLGYAYTDVDPRAMTAVARHYYCAWASLMSDVLKLRP